MIGSKPLLLHTELLLLSRLPEDLPANADVIASTIFNNDRPKSMHRGVYNRFAWLGLSSMFMTTKSIFWFFEGFQSAQLWCRMKRG
jgi:hypothetical protein